MRKKGQIVERMFVIFMGSLISQLSIAQYNLQEESGIVVFESGFEEGNKLIWDDYDENPDSENMIVQDPGPFNTEGNHVMRFRIPRGQRGGSDLIKVLPQQYDSLYVRWYMKYETGFNFEAPNHGGGLIGGSRDYLGVSGSRPNGDDFFSSTLEYDQTRHTPQLYVYYRGMYQDCANPQGSCWGDNFPCTTDEGEVYCTVSEDRDPPMPPVLETDKWYCFDMMVKLGTPSLNGQERDGELAFWVDGVNYGHWKNLWMRTTEQLKLSILWLSLFHHDGTHSEAGIMMDNVKVYSGYSAVTRLAETGSRNISVYPNPAADFINIDLPDSRSYKISLMDITGCTILEKVLSGESAKLSINNITPGIYFITLAANIDFSEIYTGKIILE